MNTTTTALAVAQPASLACSAQSVINRLRGLLGPDVVLVPVPYGEKGPRLAGWQNITVAAMDDLDYLERFAARGNCGVLLGHASGGLCSVDIDDDEVVEPFLALNPRLRCTLRTHRARGCNLWVRVLGDYPRLTGLKTRDGRKFGEWRADGGQTTIYGAAIDAGKGETTPVPYCVVVEAAPVEIAFADIVWPDNVAPPGLPAAAEAPGDEHFAQLVAEFGEPVFASTGGAVTVNENFWAALYAAEHIILYEPTEKLFYEYESATGLYVEKSPDVIKALISARMLEISRTANLPSLAKARADTLLNRIVALLRGQVEQRHAFTDQRVKAVHLATGMLRFRSSGEADWMGFSPEFYSRNQNPIAFDLRAQCPRFLGDLLQPVVHAEDIPLLQKIVGLCLLGVNLPQRILIMTGSGGLGKSTLAKIIQKLVGRENFTQLRTALLNERFELFRYMKKTVLLGVDVPPDFIGIKSAHTLKALVGNDPMDAEMKFGTANFPFDGNKVVIVTANTRLHVRLEGDFQAWQRRLLIVPFQGQPPTRKVPDFAQALIDREGSGIVNWGLLGLHEVMRDIEEAGELQLTERQRALVDNLLFESDSLRYFLNDAVERDDQADLTGTEIADAYTDYCLHRGWMPFSTELVYQQLSSLMAELFQAPQSHSIERAVKANQRGYRRVAFKPFLNALRYGHQE